ncbi:MAG: sulfotransferase domain-containing protein [Okeania sp. SIO1H6]|nr:sulfotransferase domain-containing protein [Okeania sp. SIO1H6]
MKYEDLIQDVNLNLFKEIFQFLGFKERIISRLLKIAYRKSLFSGQVSNKKHIRSGKKEQWKEYFKTIHKERFVTLFDDVLIKLNYEKSQMSWLDR